MELKIDVQQNIYDENDRIARQTNEIFTLRDIFAINVMGAPGCGKTSVIRSLLGRLDGKHYVLEGDIESDIDTQALLTLGIEVVQINTHGECHLDAINIRDALPQLSLIRKGTLFIENVGNLVCPAEFNIGEHIKMLILTVTDGSDKPYKYPLAFEKADIILINKTDLLPYVEFDEAYFMRGVRALNPDVPVHMVSAKTGWGMEEVAQWLNGKIQNPKI
jgi:hydrogenase nickel incorporation protein HypB